MIEIGVGVELIICRSKKTGEFRVDVFIADEFNTGKKRMVIENQLETINL